MKSNGEARGDTDNWPSLSSFFFRSLDSRIISIFLLCPRSSSLCLMSLLVLVGLFIGLYSFLHSAYSSMADYLICLAYSLCFLSCSCSSLMSTASLDRARDTNGWKLFGDKTSWERKTAPVLLARPEGRSRLSLTCCMAEHLWFSLSSGSWNSNGVSILMCSSYACDSSSIWPSTYAFGWVWLNSDSD